MADRVLARRVFDRGSLLPGLAAGALWLLIVLVAGWAAGDPNKAAARPAAGDLAAFRHLLRHGLGGSFRAARPLVAIRPEGLELGDVVVASHAESHYGYYSHVTAVIGPGRLLGHHVAYGIYATPLRDLRGYDHIRVLRAALEPAQQRSVADFLQRLVGARFHTLAHKRDPRWWNCAKSVWAAYLRVGIDLAPERDFILPDDIAVSPALHAQYDWGGP